LGKIQIKSLYCSRTLIKGTRKAVRRKTRLERGGSGRGKSKTGLLRPIPSKGLSKKKKREGQGARKGVRGKERAKGRYYIREKKILLGSSHLWGGKKQI